MKLQLTNKDYEVFSAYLDDQLVPADKTRLEAKLQANPELRTAFDEIAATRALLRKAKQYTAPRNFTLSPETARKYQRKSFFARLPALRFSMTLSALSLLFVLVLEITSLLPLGASSQYALAPAAAPMAEKAMAPQPTQSAQTQATMEIQWQAVPSASGMGGGAPDLPLAAMPGNILNTDPGSGGGNDTSLGKGGGGPPLEGPLVGPVQIPVESVEGLKDSAAPTAAPSAAQRAIASDQGSNPILGIPSTGDGGKMITSNGDLAEIPVQAAPAPTTLAEEPAPQPALPPWRTAELALLVFALLTGAAAFLFWRSSRR